MRGEAAGRAASAAISAASRSGVKFRLIMPDRAARIHQHAGVGALILVERMRQRDEDAGAADCASSATVDAPERDTTRWLAAMRAGRSLKNGATSQATCSLA